MDLNCYICRCHPALSRLESMHSYLSMVVVSEEVSKHVDSSKAMNVLHCPPFATSPSKSIDEDWMSLENDSSSGSNNNNHQANKSLQDSEPLLPRPADDKPLRTKEETKDSERTPNSEHVDTPKKITQELLSTIPKNLTLSLFVTTLMNKIFTTRYMGTHTMTDKGSVCGKEAMKEEYVLELIGINMDLNYYNLYCINSHSYMYL